MRSRHLDITFLFSLCCSLMINSGMVGVLLLHTESAGAIHLSRLHAPKTSVIAKGAAQATTAPAAAEEEQPPPPDVAEQPEPPPPPPPKKTLEFDPRDQFGEHDSTGEAINSVPGEQPMEAPKGSQVQAFLGRTPGDPGNKGNSANTISPTQLASLSGGSPLIGANSPAEAPRVVPKLPQQQQPTQTPKSLQPPTQKPPLQTPPEKTPPIQKPPTQTPPAQTPPIKAPPGESQPKPAQPVPTPQAPPPPPKQPAIAVAPKQPVNALPPQKQPPKENRPPVQTPANPPIATVDKTANKPQDKPPQAGVATDQPSGKDKTSNNSPAPDDLGTLPPKQQATAEILPSPTPQPSPALSPFTPPQMSPPNPQTNEQYAINISPPTPDFPQPTPPVNQNPAVNSSTNSTPQVQQVAGNPGVTGIDPTPSPDITDKESDPFSDQNSFSFRDGKVTARNGRWVKTVRPRFTQASVMDAIKIGIVNVTFLATLDEQGNVIRVVRYHSSGSDNIDLPCEEALNQWKIEPSKDKTGKAIKDVVAVTFGFE